MHAHELLKFKLLSFFILLSSLLFAQLQTRDEIAISDDIQLVRLQDSIFVHTTWENSRQYGRFPSNGMIVIKNKEAVMIDTPMDNEKTARLITFLNDSMGVQVTRLIGCHFHDDCLGGLEFIQSKNIPSFANWMTIEKCRELNLPVPSSAFYDSLNFNFNGLEIECRFLGGGHTFDNITVWLPQKKILFGGCLIKSLNSQGLGNIEDAEVENWENTVRRVMDKYPDAQIVVPGHGNYGNTELLVHTIELVKAYQNTNK